MTVKVPVQIRLTLEEIATIDAYIDRQRFKPSRAEVIRDSALRFIAGETGAHRHPPVARTTQRASYQRHAPTTEDPRYCLGPLCQRQHDYEGTGQSLRRVSDHSCLECRRISKKELHAARRAQHA